MDDELKSAVETVIEAITSGTLSDSQKEQLDQLMEQVMLKMTPEQLAHLLQDHQR